MLFKSMVALEGKSSAAEAIGLNHLVPLLVLLPSKKIPMTDNPYGASNAVALTDPSELMWFSLTCTKCNSAGYLKTKFKPNFTYLE